MHGSAEFDRHGMMRSPWLPYALIAPSVIFLGAFFLSPLVQTIWLSLSVAAAFLSTTTVAWPAI